MGLFDFISPNINKKIEKSKRVMLNEHHQHQVRTDAIQTLVGIGSPEAIEALIERLGVNFRDTIKNEQERHWVRRFLVEQFNEESIEPLKTFIAKSQSISGAIVTLRELISVDALTEFLLKTLEQYEAKDHRSVEARLQLIDALDEQPGDMITALLPYLMDHSDDVRIKVINLIEDRIRGIEGDHEHIIRAFIEAMTDPYATGRISRSVADSLIRMEANLTVFKEELEEDIPDGYSLKNGLLRKG
jgi:HEAT repeat protein